MKNKILTTIIAIFAIATMFTVFTVAYADNTTAIEPESASDEVVDGAIEFDESKFGDVNDDGNRNAADARLLLRVSAKLDDVSVYILTYGDYNRDGEITASDARTALRVSAMLENIECILHGHDMIETVIEPTCTEQGYTTNNCSRCSYSDDSKKNTTETLGHDFHLTNIVNTTCANDGYEEYTCLTCGTVKNIETGLKSTKPHSFTESTVKATCTTEGYTIKKCSVCGLTGAANVIPATGHSYKTLSSELVNFEYRMYKQVKKCSTCGKTITTYNVDDNDIQTETKLLESTVAKNIVKKFELGNPDGYVEGYDITGTKIVVYSNLRGIDIDGYYYNLDGTLEGTHDRCGKPLGIGTGMCRGACHLSWE